MSKKERFLDESKSPERRDALQLHIIRQKKMLEQEKKLTLMKINQDIDASHILKKMHQGNF